MSYVAACLAAAYPGVLLHGAPLIQAAPPPVKPQQQQHAPQPPPPAAAPTLPRIIKPRKRRKKERKPPPPPLPQSIVPQQQSQQHQQSPLITSLVTSSVTPIIGSPILSQGSNNPLIIDSSYNITNSKYLPPISSVLNSSPILLASQTSAFNSSSNASSSSEDSAPASPCSCSYCDPSAGTWTTPALSNWDWEDSLSVSSEIVTSANGHRDLEIKFFKEPKQREE